MQSDRISGCRGSVSGMALMIGKRQGKEGRTDEARQGKARHFLAATGGRLARYVAKTWRASPGPPRRISASHVYLLLLCRLGRHVGMYEYVSRLGDRRIAASFEPVIPSIPEGPDYSRTGWQASHPGKAPLLRKSTTYVRDR